MPWLLTLDHVRRALRGHEARTIEVADARRAAVALVLLDGPPSPPATGLEILLIRRAERPGDPWSGQIAFPGGRYEPGDPALLATAIRETREETGVDLTTAERLGSLDDLYPRTPTLPPVVVRPFVFGLSRRPPLVPSDEVQRAFWLPLSRLGEAGVRRDITLTLRGVERTFPAYLFDDELIWGMTERILTPFIELSAKL
ncbi:MAG TPA: CoA pyrophosphatase [Gemmatimonadales bacterium]|nr:CoA pyrophosphatase [Gemmatimonadales bacterium]